MDAPTGTRTQIYGLGNRYSIHLSYGSVFLRLVLETNRKIKNHELRFWTRDLWGTNHSQINVRGNSGLGGLILLIRVHQYLNLLTLLKKFHKRLVNGFFFGLSSSKVHHFRGGRFPGSFALKGEWLLLKPENCIIVIGWLPCRGADF